MGKAVHFFFCFFLTDNHVTRFVLTSARNSPCPSSVFRLLLLIFCSSSCSCCCRCCCHCCCCSSFVGCYWYKLSMSQYIVNSVVPSSLNLNFAAQSKYPPA